MLLRLLPVILGPWDRVLRTVCKACKHSGALNRREAALYSTALGLPCQHFFPASPRSVLLKHPFSFSGQQKSLSRMTASKGQSESPPKGRPDLSCSSCWDSYRPEQTQSKDLNGNF